MLILSTAAVPTKASEGQIFGPELYDRPVYSPPYSPDSRVNYFRMYEKIVPALKMNRYVTGLRRHGAMPFEAMFSATGWLSSLSRGALRRAAEMLLKPPTNNYVFGCARGRRKTFASR